MLWSTAYQIWHHREEAERSLQTEAACAFACVPPAWQPAAAFLSSLWRQQPSCKGEEKGVRLGVSTKHTFIQIFVLKSNIMFTCCVLFLEWHFVLKALTTFTFIQPRRKRLWGVKINFQDKTESEQEHKKQLLAKIYPKYYSSSKIF